VHLSLLGPSWLTAFGEGPWRYEHFHYGTVLELVLDRVRVMRIGRFEKFFKMIFG
jgi:hypothetical protein